MIYYKSKNDYNHSAVESAVPKRTNKFQTLVALIERALAPQGAKITESAAVPAGKRGRTREIDVLIEGEFGPYTMKIAVEAKDERRKMDVTKFESIVGKYRSKTGCRVDRVVVISRRGFTQEVIDAAHEENISLLRLDRAMELDWSAETPQTLVFSIEPHVAAFEFPDEVPAGDVRRISLIGRFLCRCCGKNHGVPMQLALLALANEGLREDLRAAASRASSSACCKIAWRFPETIRLKADATEYDVREFKAHLHATFARGPLKADAYRRGEQVIHHLSGDFGAKHIEFVVPEGDRPHQISMKIEDVPAQARHSAASCVIAPPQLQRCEPPEGWAELIAELERRLGPVDASLTKSVDVHNYHNGQDYCVPLLMKGYLGGPGRFASAILFAGGESGADLTTISEASKLVNGSRLDRIVILRQSHFADEVYERAAGDSRIVLIEAQSQPEVIDRLIRALAPPMILYCNTVASLELRGLSDAEGKFTGISETARIESNGKPVVLVRDVHHMFAHGLWRQTMLTLASQIPGTPHFAEVRFNIALPLRPGVCLIAENGQTVPLHWLEGEASVRAMLVTLDRFQISERFGKSLFQFSYEGDRRVSALVGDLPRNHNWTFEGLSLDPAESFLAALSAHAFPQLSDGTSPSPRTTCRPLFKVTLNPGTCPLETKVMRWADFHRELAMQKSTPRHTP